LAILGRTRVHWRAPPIQSTINASSSGSSTRIFLNSEPDENGLISGLATSPALAAQISTTTRVARRQNASMFRARSSSRRIRRCEFLFWLNDLNSYGNPANQSGINHLIDAFISSVEYHQRFGQ
jgi:hypothetical protein